MNARRFGQKLYSVGDDGELIGREAMSDDGAWLADDVVPDALTPIFTIFFEQMWPFLKSSITALGRFIASDNHQAGSELPRKSFTATPGFEEHQTGEGLLTVPFEIGGVAARRMVVPTQIWMLQRISQAMEAANQLEQLLDEFNLQTVRKSPGDVLSGGERRRTEIARALASNPKFILLDEPFAGVDPIAVEDIQRIVNQLRHKGIGVLITDHNVQETLHITDRAYLLFEGKILKEGTAEELAEDETVRRVYLGQNFTLRPRPSR